MIYDHYNTDNMVYSLTSSKPVNSFLILPGVAGNNLMSVECLISYIMYLVWAPQETAQPQERKYIKVSRAGNRGCSKLSLPVTERFFEGNNDGSIRCEVFGRCNEVSYWAVLLARLYWLNNYSICGLPVFHRT